MKKLVLLLMVCFISLVSRGQTTDASTEEKMGRYLNDPDPAKREIADDYYTKKALNSPAIKNGWHDTVYKVEPPPQKEPPMFNFAELQKYTPYIISTLIILLIIAAIQERKRKK